MDSPAAARISAIKALGTVSEIAAFTERKEITQVKASDDVKAQLLKMIQGAMSDQVRTVDQVDDDVAELMAEITKPAPKEMAETAPLPEGDPPNAEILQGGNTHSNPHKQNPLESNSTSHLLTLTDRNGEGDTKIHPDWQELDTGKTPPSNLDSQG